MTDTVPANPLSVTKCHDTMLHDTKLHDTLCQVEPVATDDPDDILMWLTEY